jgi:hypothetical protein
MSTNSREREMVKQAYPSKNWTRKVNEMSDTQVYAIYLRFRREGKIQ